MTTITTKELIEFQELYEKYSGEKISLEDARLQAETLVNLVKVLVFPHL